MQFQDVFREERYYCNHFFRLLCEKLIESPRFSGLARVLEELGIELPTDEEIQKAEIYTEVAVFRDVFAIAADKTSFLEELYDLFLPMMKSQYENLITQPVRPSVISNKLGYVHPSKYKDIIDEPDFERSDVLFYREMGALFNAKPDYLILLPHHSIWIEAKCSSAFSSSQISRMRNIGELCTTKMFSLYFAGREPAIVLLGSKKRHARAQKFENTRFLSWDKCAEISSDVFPTGTADITSRALAHVSA